MHTIERRFGGTPREYTVYTRDEADAAGLDYEHWTVCEPGQYALTDDEYVGLLVRKQRYEKKKVISYFMTFSFARQWLSYKRGAGGAEGKVRGDPWLEFEPYLETGGFNYTAPQTWQEKEAKKGRTKDAVRVYARLFLAREGRLTQEDWDVIGQMYRPTEKIPRATAKRLFKEEEIKDMAAEEIRSLMVEEGLDEKRVLEMYQEAYEEGRSGGKPGVMKSVADSLRDLLDMKPKGSSQRQLYAEEISFDALSEKVDEATGALPEGSALALPEGRPPEQAAAEETLLKTEEAP